MIQSIKWFIHSLYGLSSRVASENSSLPNYIVILCATLKHFIETSEYIPDSWAFCNFPLNYILGAAGQERLEHFSDHSILSPLTKTNNEELLILKKESS